MTWWRDHCRVRDRRGEEVFLLPANADLNDPATEISLEEARKIDRVPSTTVRPPPAQTARAKRNKITLIAGV